MIANHQLEYSNTIHIVFLKVSTIPRLVIHPRYSCNGRQMKCLIHKMLVSKLLCTLNLIFHTSGILLKDNFMNIIGKWRGEVFFCYVTILPYFNNKNNGDVISNRNFLSYAKYVSLCLIKCHHFTFYLYKFLSVSNHITTKHEIFVFMTL